jgi:hypothetical protein
MPSTARFSSATGGPFCWTPSVAEPSVVACDVGAISAGGSISVTVTASVAADPSIPLSAFVVVRPTGLDPVDANNGDTLDLTPP